ncbi:hypothetical protein BKP45_00710 [Anaerobacillus alkalidiazotrophicus]|uniref:Uncharacterized protein n=1 Tax=Anaerobacillus alkalidiazotrophicus TaxID=472963 RepID=A0A1S2MCC7_9BACI|nr:hypothetical protein [Anaerobacillus alkalidiazotrophicus]OIJ21335.1 hypothetical protein BKP45_00710 [Anaerobacillus alkalidiazotrophicus]
MRQDQHQDNRFYKQLWFAWARLILMPPVGIYTLWKFGHYSKGLRIALTLVFGLLFLYMITGDEMRF